MLDKTIAHSPARQFLHRRGIQFDDLLTRDQVAALLEAFDRERTEALAAVLARMESRRADPAAALPLRPGVLQFTRRTPPRRSTAASTTGSPAARQGR